MLNDADIATLTAELAKPSYAGKEDVEVAAMLSVPGTTDAWEDVPFSRLFEVLQSSGLIGVLRTNKGQDTDAADVLEAFMNPRFGATVNMGEPFSKALIEKFSVKGLLSPANRAIVEALGRRKLTKAEEILGKGKAVNHLDVARARGRG